MSKDHQSTVYKNKAATRKFWAWPVGTMLLFCFLYFGIGWLNAALFEILAIGLPINVSIMIFNCYYLELTAHHLKIHSVAMPFFCFKIGLTDIRWVIIDDIKFGSGHSAWFRVEDETRRFRIEKLPHKLIQSFITHLQAKGIEVDYRYIKSASV